MAIVDLPLAFGIFRALWSEEAGEQRELWSVRANPGDARSYVIDNWRSPFSLFGKEPLHVDRGMDRALANGTEAKAGYGHGSTGMVCALSQLAVTGVPMSRTSPV